jgi:hypothetical protein
MDIAKHLKVGKTDLWRKKQVYGIKICYLQHSAVFIKL